MIPCLFWTWANFNQYGNLYQINWLESNIESPKNTCFQRGFWWAYVEECASCLSVRPSCWMYVHCAAGCLLSAVTTCMCAPDGHLGEDARWLRLQNCHNRDTDAYMIHDKNKRQQALKCWILISIYAKSDSTYNVTAAAFILKLCLVTLKETPQGWALYDSWWLQNVLLLGDFTTYLSLCDKHRESPT